MEIHNVNLFLQQQILCSQECRVLRELQRVGVDPLCAKVSWSSGGLTQPRFMEIIQTVNLCKENKPSIHQALFAKRDKGGPDVVEKWLRPSHEGVLIAAAILAN